VRVDKVKSRLTMPTTRRLSWRFCLRRTLELQLGGDEDKGDTDMQSCATKTTGCDLCVYGMILKH
jgi:hypothetical protein